MNKETLNIYLYGGFTLVSKRLLAKWPIEVQRTTRCGSTVWKARKKYQLDYSPRSDIVLTGLKVSTPKQINILLPKRLNIEASMPMYLQRGNKVTVMLNRWHRAVTAGVA